MKSMKHLTRHIIAQYFLGIIFLFSGISKVINIPNTASIIREYFQFISINLIPYLYDIFGVILIGSELIIALCLLLNIFKKITINITIVILLFFTCITLFIAIDGSFSDCGCFGEQLRFTGWQSFVKNIIFLTICFVARRGQYTKQVDDKNNLLIFPIFLGAVSLCLLGLKGQPIYENGKFKVGVDLCAPPRDISQPILVIDQLRTNKNGDKIYVPVGDTLFSQNKNAVVGIIRNDDEIASSEMTKLVNSVLHISNEIDGKPILLTSLLKHNSRIEKLIPIGKSDSSVLARIISTNIGIIVVKEGLIIKKWQRNALGWQMFPKSMSDI